MESTVRIVNSPRFRGVREQFERSKWFCALADQATDEAEQFRLRMAALYCARAVVEIMLDAAEGQELPGYRDKDHKKCRKDFEQELAPTLIHYFLIEKIRIHDFHRFGCLAPHTHYRRCFFGGSMKLTPSKGAAVLTVPPSGPQVTLTGNSSVKDQRSLCNVDGSFFDDVGQKYLPLREILAAYLEGIPTTMARFEAQLVA